MSIATENLLGKARNGIELLRHSVVAMIASGTVIFGGVAVHQAATNDSIVVEPISVPSDFEGKGFSGTIATQRILDEVSAFQSLSNSRKRAVGIADKPPSDSSADLETPVGGVNFKSVANVIRQAMGKKVIRISGEIVTKESKKEGRKTFELRLRRLPDRKILARVESDGTPDDLFRLAAYALVESVDPYTAARAYFRKKDTPNALRLIKICLTNDDPEDDKWAWLLRASMDSDLGKFDDVLADANAALQLDPKFSHGYFWQSVALREKKAPDEALKAAEEGIRLGPNFPGNYVQKGRALRDLGRHEEAIQSFDMAIKSDPSFPPAYNQSGLSLLKLKRWKEAIERFEHAIHLEPETAWFHSNLAEALHGQGRSDEALKELYLAEHLDALNPAFYVLAGTIELSLGKDAEAVKSAASLRRMIEQEKKTIPTWAAKDAEKLLALLQK
jgi:tetratricopeptide (TPR) repeat protein